MRNISSRKNADTYKVTYPIIFWMFMMGSVSGFILEGIWCILKKGAWEDHSATVWGPFCIIYGITAVVLYLASIALKDTSVIVQFFVCAVAGSAIEYFSSLFQELCFGSVSWDYSRQTFNIGGRISLKMTIIWGLLGAIFVQVIFPVFVRILNVMNGKVWTALCVALSAFMVVNLMVTSAAVIRWGERLESVPASNDFEEFLDEKYDDEAMSEIFPNMKFVTKG